MPVSKNRNTKKKKRADYKDVQIGKSALVVQKEMYSALTINGFRRFDKIEFKELGKVNLIFGSNNSGKTTVLEAIFTHACGLNPVPFITQILLKRQHGTMTGALDLGEKLISLFHDQNTLPYTFSISANIENHLEPYIVKHTFSPSQILASLNPRALGQPDEGYSKHIFTPYSESNLADKSKLNPQQAKPLFLGRLETSLNKTRSTYDLTFPLEATSSAPFKTGYIQDILAHREERAEIGIYSHLKRYGELDKFIEELKIIFPYISEIDMIPYPDGSAGQIYVKTTNSQRLPLYAFGDGLRRWYHLIGSMIVYSNSVHCIEEIDATFHPKAQKILSPILMHYAQKYNNQIFITSHSIEFADAFLSALYEEGTPISSEEDLVRVFTLKLSKDHVHTDVWPMTGREAYENRQKYELELR